MQQLNQQAQNQISYNFKSVSEYIQSDFQSQFVKKISLDRNHNEAQQNNIKIERNKKNKGINNQNNYLNEKTHFNIFIQTDNSGYGNWIINNEQRKLIYPSSITCLIQFINYILNVSTILKRKRLYDQQIILQILSLKSEQIIRIGQIVYNIFNLIKLKQIKCYKYLKDYMRILINGIFKHQLQAIQILDLTDDEQMQFNNQLQQLQESKKNQIYQSDKLKDQFQHYYNYQKKKINEQIKIQKISKYLTFYAEKSKKIDFLSQIIYELDSNYQILPVIKQLLKCQTYHNQTYHFYDNGQFYQIVLYQIIQMRNHIKLDHYYTLSKIHHIFSFFVSKYQTFGEILNSVAQYSENQLKIQELLGFFKAQLKLKRLIFKGQLYWMSYKEIFQQGKQKTFQQFVQDHANNLILLSNQNIEFFINFNTDFIKKVNFFEQQINRLKYYQIILGKFKKFQISIKNLPTYIKNLQFNQLKSISDFILNHNPISQILKGQNLSQIILKQIQLSIQTFGRLKFQQINKVLLLMHQKRRLSQSLFLFKSFMFELKYQDCYNFFKNNDIKSNQILNNKLLKNNQKKQKIHDQNNNLSILINRQKRALICQYDQKANQNKFSIYQIIQYNQKILLLSLILSKNNQDIVNETEKQIIEQILLIISIKIIGINVIKQINKIRTYFSYNQKQFHQFTQIYNILKIKNFINKLSYIIDQDKKILEMNIKNEKSRQLICLISKLSIKCQKKILQKMKNIEKQIKIKDIRDKERNKKQISALNIKIMNYFLEFIENKQKQKIKDTIKNQNMFSNFTQKVELQEKKLNENQNLIFNFTNLLILDSDKETFKRIIKDIQVKLIKQRNKLIGLKSLQYQNKEEFYLFDQFSGYKIKQIQNFRQNRQQRKFPERKNLKKGIFSPFKSQKNNYTNIMDNIQKRVAIQIIKQSMNLRKLITKLELEDKQMRDEILWETSKLQHNVINKIHAFITESNIDQEQSYINFKYTVNLQTIKGMQNVIKQQTQLAIKTHQQTLWQSNRQDKQIKDKNTLSDFFLTNVNKVQDEQSNIQVHNSRLLNMNVDTIFNHMKKIRIFAAWKKIYRNLDLTNQQWKNFNKNVAKILHNDQNNQKIQKINQKRNQCFKQNILCSLLNEQNKLLSQKIRKSKMDSLQKTIENYRNKLTINEKNQQDQIQQK